MSDYINFSFKPLCLHICSDLDNSKPFTGLISPAAAVVCLSLCTQNKTSLVYTRPHISPTDTFLTDLFLSIEG